MIKVFQSLGFFIHTKCGQTGRVTNMGHIGEYEGVSVKFPSNSTFIIQSGNIKYFGNISLPEMSIKGRSKDEVEKMVKVMKHYHKVIENNQPW